MNRQYDVIVVGSGNAGMSAAHAARQSGATVAVIDAAPEAELGGNTWHTAGAFRFVHDGLDELRPLIERTSDHRLESTEVPPYPGESYLCDLARMSQGLGNTSLQRTLVRESRAAVDWLAEMGMSFELLYERQSYVVDGRFRFWGGIAAAVSDGGKGLVAAHLELARSTGVEVFADSPLTRLVVDERGQVNGVEIGGRKPRTLRCAAVVLACGGFESDVEQRRRYLGPEWVNARVRGTRHNTGMGLELARSIGAAAHGNFRACHAVAWDVASGQFGDRELTNRYTRQSYPLGVYVNRDGLRFVDEGEDFRNYTYATIGRVILAQPGGVAFQLFDDRTRPLLKPAEYEMPGVTEIRADSIEELARLAGIDPAGLVGTVEAFNAATVTGPYDPTTLDGLGTVGIDPPKSNWALPLEQPPFYAFPVTCGITFTFGGLHIDLNAAVLDERQRPIPGLYAAGEIVGGLFGDGYPGGSGLTAGAVFGRRAGMAAAGHSAAARSSSSSRHPSGEALVARPTKNRGK